MADVQSSGAGRGGRIVGFGELLIRLSPPDKRLMVQAQHLDVEIGGAEANVVAAMASLGHEAAMISRIADNPLGRLAVGTLASRGVDVSHVTRAPGRMGLYFLEVGQGARASAITYDRAGSTFASAHADDFAFADALDGARLLHLSGITPALGSGSAAAAIEAARTASAAGAAVSFDGNYRAQLWSTWDSDPRAILSELVGHATILFGNHRDIALLTGRSFAGDGAERRRAAAEAAFEAFPKLRLIASTARHVTGADSNTLSARADTRDGFFQSEDTVIHGIVDRIGTGDAFAAGALHAWTGGADCRAIAENGLMMATLKHSIPGDMPLIDKRQLAACRDGLRDVRR